MHTSPSSHPRISRHRFASAFSAAKMSLATHRAIDEAIDAAVAAVPAMAAMGAYERKAILEKVVAKLKKRAEIVKTLTVESGNPIKDVRGEVTRTIDTFQVPIEESTRIYGETIPLDISVRNKGLQVK